MNSKAKEYFKKLFQPLVTQPIILMIIFFVVLLLLLEYCGIIKSDKLEYYRFVGLASGSVLLIANYIQLVRRADIEEDRKNIQEKSRLDERFKTGIEFLSHSNSKSLGLAWLSYISVLSLSFTQAYNVSRNRATGL